jgi:RNA polymerase sigma factor (sigma-70 family)
VDLAFDCPSSALEFKSIEAFEFGGPPVCNPAYLYLEYAPTFIADGSSLESYAFKSGRFEWTDDEIKAIRVVLKKLTSIRIMNPTDVEDLVQETLLTMVSKRPGAELAKGPLVWSMGILRRKLGNYYRKVQRYTPLHEHKAAIRQLIPAASPERKVFHEELKAIVDAVLPEIPPFQRQALELMIAGLNAREITEELHPVRYQNVINRLYRGRKKLAEALARYGCGPDATPGFRKMKTSRGKKAGNSRKATSAKPEDTALSRK